MPNPNDEASVAAMKLAKMTPYGRLLLGDATDRRAGVQKKTKRYMEPSKMVDASPSDRTLGLKRMDQRFGLGVASFWLGLGLGLELGAVSP